jgi:hypothetical protein
MDNVGGSMYWASTLELQSAIPGVPQEYGLKATAFVDAGSVFNYGGPTTFPGSTQSLQVANSNVVRSSVGAGLTWASPFGALTVDYAVTRRPMTWCSRFASVPEGSKRSAATGDALAGALENEDAIFAQPPRLRRCPPRCFKGPAVIMSSTASLPIPRTRGHLGRHAR